MDLPFGLQPHENDPGAWGASMLNNAEMLLALLDAAEVRSIVEVGAYAGDLTRFLLLRAERDGGSVVALDPSPQPKLEALERERPELRLVRETSLDGLEHIEIPDAIILDGDHNWYTVTQELERIDRRTEGRLPLVLFHDVCWPHARRDDYFDPEAIPAEFRQPIEPEGGLYPGVETTREGGLPYHNPAAREGGPRNGVLTAAEDFAGKRSELRLAVIPAFFGLGVLWHQDAPWSGAVADIVDPWDRNPLLERLERNRALHLASSHVQLRLAETAQERVRQHEELLDRMLNSKAFAAAEMFLRVRQRGAPAFSRAEARRLLSR